MPPLPPRLALRHDDGWWDVKLALDGGRPSAISSANSSANSARAADGEERGLASRIFQARGCRPRPAPTHLLGEFLGEFLGEYLGE